MISGRSQSSARDVTAATAVAATVTRIAQKGAKREPRIALEIGTKRVNLTPTNVQRPLKRDESVPKSARYSATKAIKLLLDVCIIATAVATGFDVRR